MRRLFPPVTVLVLLGAGCKGSGGGGAHPQVFAFDDGTGLARARVERTVHSDGSETLHGETIEDLNPQVAITLRVIEDVELDATGALSHADLSLWNTFGATEVKKRVVIDPSAGQVRVTRPAGSVVWPVAADEPWLYYPFLSDIAFSLQTSSPLAAWVIYRGVDAAAQVRFLAYDNLETIEVPAGATAPTLYAGADTLHYDATFVSSIEMGGIGATLTRTATDPGPLLSFTVPEVSATVTFPDCTLPGTSEAFTVTSTDGTLVQGEVDLPTAAAPHAYVVFNAGTGGADREEPVGGIPRWRCLAKPLLEAGIAVARYDDRGHGATGGTLSTVTFKDRSDDAVAVANYVATRADLDPARLFLLGHSEGVAHVCEAAAAVPQVDGLLLLSGVGTNGASVWLEQSATVYGRYGMPQPWIDAVQAEKQQIVDQISAGTFGSPTLGGFPVQFWKEFFAMDGGQLAKNAARPAAIFQGEADWQVDPRNAPMLAAALGSAGVLDVTVHLYPGLGHFESEAPAGFPSSGDEYWLPINWNATLTSDLVAWVQAH